MGKANRRKPTNPNAPKKNSGAQAVAAARGASSGNRTRNLLIGLVALLVVALVVAFFLIKGGAGGDDAASGQSGQSGAAVDTSAPFEKAIVVTKDGVKVAGETTGPTMTEYFDYTCHACADQDVAMGARMSAAAADGTMSIRYIPVRQVDMAYTEPATDASLLVAENAPDQWVAFHHALMAYFSEQYNGGSEVDVIQSNSKSEKKVKEIAKEVGVPDDVIKKFTGDGANDYLADTTAYFRAANYEGRDGIYTPEYVMNEKSTISLDGVKTVDDLIKRIGDGLGVTIK